MTTPKISTIDSLNIAVAAQLPVYLQSIGVEIITAVLGASDDVDSDVYRFQLSSDEAGYLPFPACAVSRTSIGALHGNRATADEFIAQLDGEEMQLEYRLVEVGYSARCYFDSFASAEHLINQLFLLGHPKIPFQYSFAPLSQSINAVAHIDQTSIQNHVITRSEKDRTGEFFKVSFDMNVNALLFGNLSEARIVKDISFTLYDYNTVLKSLGQDFLVVDPKAPPAQSFLTRLEI
jgi:hypothetical protein